MTWVRPFALLAAFLCLCPCAVQADIKIGGPSFEGKEVICDYPQSLWQPNTGGRDGSGLCVFTSIEFAARFQNELRLWNFQADMKKEPGGGYPSKVDAMIKRYGAGTPYIQSEGGDASILEAALKTGRMPAITYCAGRDDPHYHTSIAHMVCLAYLDKDVAAILDNNFPTTELEWMPRETFLQKWKGNGGGWCVVLLAAPPAPVPHNTTVAEQLLPNGPLRRPHVDPPAPLPPFIVPVPEPTPAPTPAPDASTYGLTPTQMIAGSGVLISALGLVALVVSLIIHLRK